MQAESEVRFSAYVEGLASVIGHADRAKPLRDYCLGLMLPGERWLIWTRPSKRKRANAPAHIR